MTIFEEFYFWILSMFEDNPIPHEILHLYFIINLENHNCNLSFAGSELKQNPITNYEYYPLEGYFFANKSFNNIKDIYIAKITVKELIEQALENNEFRSKFRGKHIYLCQKHQEIEYSFKI